MTVAVKTMCQIPGCRLRAGRPEDAGKAVRGRAKSAAALAAVAAAGALAACSGQPSASLPPKSSQLPSAPPASSPPGAPSAKAAVAAAYAAYFPASKAAETGPAGRAGTTLAPYAAQPYLSQVLAQMDAYRAQGETASGYVIPHITRITVRGKAAEVYDCQDASHAALASSRAGQVIPGTTGSARTSLIASLALGGDGRWRLTSLAHVDTPCSPATSSSS